MERSLRATVVHCDGPAAEHAHALAFVDPPQPVCFDESVTSRFHCLHWVAEDANDEKDGVHSGDDNRCLRRFPG